MRSRNDFEVRESANIDASGRKGAMLVRTTLFERRSKRVSGSPVSIREGAIVVVDEG